MKTKKLPKQRDTVLILLLCGLIFFRFPFMAVLYYALPEYKFIGREIMQSGTYLLTAVLIFYKRDSLEKYNIGIFTLFFILVIPFIYFAYIYFSSGLLKRDAIFEMAVSIVLIITLIIKRPKLRVRGIKKIMLFVGIAIGAGIVTGLLTGLLLKLQGTEKIAYNLEITYYFRSFISQLSTAAVIEEPLFRGFLWGYLKDCHWKDGWILIFQAALFMLGHFYYFGNMSYSFFLVVPLGGLIFGILVWRTKSIGTSMITHGLTNTLGSVVAHII